MQKTYHKIVNGDSREMLELKDESIHLVLTSPPYWQLKDYGTENQISRIYFKFLKYSLKNDRISCPMDIFK
jgi:DNA modification methylase